MAEPGAVTRALLATVPDGNGAAGLAERICRACVDGLDIDGAAVSLLTASASRETLWASDAVAQQLEELQFTLNEGACMEAATTGNPVLVTDLRHSVQTVRWPMFAAAVIEQTPVGALFAFPLQWGVVNLGVLDLYRVRPGGLPPEQWRDAVSAVDTAALLLLGQRTDPGGGNWLDHSAGFRAEVHQATGMVLAQLDVDPADALARLRAHAFVTGRLLVDVARDVITGELVFTPDTT